MKHFFSNKNTKERRLIGFAGEAPKGPEDSPDAPKPTTEKKDPSAEKVGEADDPKKLEDAVDKAAKGKAEKARDDAKDSVNSIANKELDAAKVDFEAAMNMFAGDPELALKEVNQGTDKFKLNADKSGIELTKPPKEAAEDTGDAAATKPGEGKEDGKEELPPLTEDEQALKKSMMQLGLNEKGAEEFARGMTAISNALKALKNMFGKGGPEGGSDDKKTDGDPDKKKPEAGPDGTPGVTPEKRSDSPEGGSEDFDPKKSENPKEDGDKVKTDIETMKGRKEKINAKIDEFAKEDVTKEERDEMRPLLDELDTIDADIKTKEAEATALDKELASRADFIGKAWEAATPKGGLIENVALDIEDGNDIVVTLAGGVSFTDLPAKQQATLTAMGIATEGNALVLKDVPPTMYEEAGKAKRDIIINTLAGLKGESVDEDTDGGLEPGADTKEASPEKVTEAAKQLNEKLETLQQLNPDFMKESPIGQIFSKMSYRAEGDNIMCSIPASVSGQFRNIMESNGRTIAQSGDDYTVSYPDGTKVEMKASQPADYPSRLAWGGTKGNVESQLAAAKSGMDQWASIIGKTPLGGTKPIDAKVNPDISVVNPESPDAIALQAKLDGLKGRLGKGVDSTVFGKFVKSLDAGSSGKNIVLTSKTDEKIFSHIYNKIDLAGVTDGPPEKDSEGNYVMKIAGDDTTNIMYNLNRWEKFLGSTVEDGGAQNTENVGPSKEKDVRKAPKQSESTEAAPNKPSLSDERFKQIQNEVATILQKTSTSSRDYPAAPGNSVSIFKSGDDTFGVSADNGLLDRSSFTREERNAITEGLEKNGPNKMVSKPMTGEELEKYVTNFISRLNNAS